MSVAIYDLAADIWPYIKREAISMPAVEQDQQHQPAAQDILVVDDEDSITSLLAEVLMDAGYQVRVAHDGAGALLAIQESLPALVLMDIAMPVMTGDEVLRHLRGHGYRLLPVVMMSAGHQLHPMLREGATAVIPKPFDIDVVLDIVTSALGRDLYEGLN